MMTDITREEIKVKAGQKTSRYHLAYFGFLDICVVPTAHTGSTLYKLLIKRLLNQVHANEIVQLRHVQVSCQQTGCFAKGKLPDVLTAVLVIFLIAPFVL